MATNVILNITTSIEKIRDNFPQEEFDNDVRDILFDLCYTVLDLITYGGYDVTDQTKEMVKFCRDEVVRQHIGSGYLEPNVKQLLEDFDKKVSNP